MTHTILPFLLLAFVLVVSLIILLLYLYLTQKHLLKKVEIEHTKELDTYKTNLYSYLFHELHTPLTTILGMAKKIKDDLTKTSPLFY